MNSVSWSGQFPGQSSQVGAVRRFTREHIGRNDALEVVVSELATNAIRHSRSGEPGGWFTLQLQRFPETVQVRVSDLGGPKEPTCVEDAGTGSSGRGLTLVDGFSIAWGVEGGEVGRVVWAELALQTPSRG